MRSWILFLFSVSEITLMCSGLRAIINEGRSKTIRCYFGRVINIYFARYEGSYVLCPSNEVTAIVESLCEGKFSCTVYAKDDVYKDSCPVANEKLYIRYGCEDAADLFTSTRMSVSQSLEGQDGTSEQALRHSSTGAGVTTDTISLGNASHDLNETTIDPRSSKQGSNLKEDKVTIAALISGCILGLLVIAVIFIAIFRRHNMNKMPSHGPDNAVLLQINQEPTATIINNGQNKAPSSTPQKGFTNQLYQVPYRETIVSASTDTSRKFVVEGNCARNGDETVEKFVHENEYCDVEDTDILTTSLPSYDVANASGFAFQVINAANGYNHAFYDEYETPTSVKQVELTDEYSTPREVLCKSGRCPSCSGRNSKNVYENDQNAKKLENDQNDKKLDAKDNQNSLSGNPHYANVSFDNSSGDKQKLVTKGNGDPVNNPGHSYMPMTFGSSVSEDVYVPIMSPTSLTSPTDVFDYTYQS